MATRILQKNASVLRKIAAEVPLKDIGGRKIQAVIHDMKDALHHEEDGVAIAAPQVGKSLRIFIILGSVVHTSNKSEGEPTEERGGKNDLVFINPILIKRSRKTELLDEGCLSVRPVYGKVRRAIKATVQAYDEEGKKFTRGGSGLLAQIFQHEIDHLDGILFIDKATDLREANRKKRRIHEKAQGI